jgi:hypothetical protein
MQCIHAFVAREAHGMGLALPGGPGLSSRPNLKEGAMNVWFQRMGRAMRLDASLYEEVEADRTATGQALGVVAISALAAGIGGAAMTGGVGILAGILASLLGWVVWAGLIYLVGTKMLPEANTRSDVGELLRTTGFATAPGVFRVLAAIPLIGPLIALAAARWMYAAFVVAVRQALDYESTGRAMLVCFIGFCVYMGIAIAFFLLLGGAALVGSQAMH